MKGWNPKFIFAVLSASVGSGFQHGYHIGVINVPKDVLVKWIRENQASIMDENAPEAQVDSLWLIFIYIFQIGGVFGSLLTAYFAQRFGPKTALMWNNVILLVGILFMSCAKASQFYAVLIIGRFLTGVSAGLDGTLCPIYLSEIAPVASRGATTSIYFLVVVVSLLASHTFGLKEVMGSDELWPYMFLISMGPCLLQLMTLSLCPKSPKYLLLSEGDEIKAEEALIWFRNTSDVEAELAELKEEKEILQQLPKVSVKAMFTDSLYRTPWILCLMIVISHQFCGFTVVIYFSTEVFRQTGFSEKTSTYSTVTVGIISVLVTIYFIFVLENVGRRILLLISYIGMAFNTVFLMLVLRLTKDEEVKEYMKYCTIAAVLLLTVMFALGAGPIPWLITAEMFHHLARPLAVSMTVSVNWLSLLLVTTVVKPLQEIMWYYVFIIFVFFDSVFFFFVAMFLPETGGKTQKEILELFYEL